MDAEREASTDGFTASAAPRATRRRRIEATAFQETSNAKSFDILDLCGSVFASRKSRGNATEDRSLKAFWCLGNLKRGICVWATSLVVAHSPHLLAQVVFTDDELLAAERPIAAGQSFWMEELTFMEIRDLIADGTTTAIVPTGGIEENGPYLATGKHNLILEAICPAIAEKLGNALCAPIVKFVPQGNIDPPSGAMKFPGSISLTAATYEALLTDIALSLRQSGFTDIVLIGDSGGNQRGMANVAAALTAQWGDGDKRIHYVREFYDPGWVETEQFTERELGVAESTHDGYHDDIWVTAMMMVTDPDQVRVSQRVDAGLASINGVSIVPVEEFVELGEQMVEFRAESTANEIRRILSASTD